MEEQSALPNELWESEILPKVDHFASAVALGKVNKRLNRSWKKYITKIPKKFYPSMDSELLASFPALEVALNFLPLSNSSQHFLHRILSY